MFNFNEDQAKTHLNNFWSYLDELAEKNPEEYKKFISQQMTKGIESVRNEKGMQEDKILKVQPYMCIRFKLLSIKKENHDNKDDLLIHENNKNELSEVPKVLFTYDFQSSAFGKKIIEEPKVYLNIVFSEGFTGPTDDKGLPLSTKDLNDDSKWRYIPTQFRPGGKSKSLSGKIREFYDVVISSFVIDKMKGNEELKKSLLAYIVRKFGIFIENRYKLFTDNVKILPDKKYKSVKPLPEEFKVTGGGTGKNLDNTENADGHSSSQNKTPSKSEEPIKSKHFLEENKIIIPGISENYPNTNTFYNANTNKNSKPSNIFGGNLKQKSNKQEPAPKKILIEEIKQKSKIEIKKTILSDSQMEVKFDFSQFDSNEIKMSNLDLEIATNGIKLKLEETKYIENEDYDPIDMAFNFDVDVDNCPAKFNSKEKTLKIILNKII